MRIGEIFSGARKPVISFEVFPPKTDKAMGSFSRVLPRLVELKPDYMTVTYGALGSTQTRTLEIAGMIKRDHGMEAACHLTCVGSTSEDIDRILEEIEGVGIENIVALRGDPPEGEMEFVPPEGGYRHADELISHIRKRGGFDAGTFELLEGGVKVVHTKTESDSSRLCVLGGFNPEVCHA